MRHILTYEDAENAQKGLNIFLTDLEIRTI